jgi:riboflavin kinase/FMN adenylyltransferase
MKPLHLGIGIFDGVHGGHRYLLQSAIEAAKQENALSGALTFHPHPKQVLKLPNAPKLIYTIQQRYWLLKQLGCDSVFIKTFTEQWSHSTPEHFFTYLMRLYPNLAHLYVVEDFRFGNKRQGTLSMLQTFCKAHTIQLHVIPHLKQGGEKICSTRIRKALGNGLVSLANQLLYKPYHCIGYITPTWQFQDRCEMKLKDGTYAGRIARKKEEQSVTIQVKEGLYHVISDLEPSFQKVPCLVEFQKEL